MIAYRKLNCLPDNIDIHIKIFQPIEHEINWSCTYEIFWPEGPYQATMYGIDSMQALILSIYSIGADLHISRYHKEGLLVYERPGRGFGFPLAHLLRDKLSGDDLEFF